MSRFEQMAIDSYVWLPEVLANLPRYYSAETLNLATAVVSESHGDLPESSVSWKDGCRFHKTSNTRPKVLQAMALHSMAMSYLADVDRLATRQTILHLSADAAASIDASAKYPNECFLEY